MVEETRQDKPYDFSLLSISRGILLALIPISTYILGALPALIVFYYIYPIIPFAGILFILPLSILLFLCFFLLILCETFIPGLIIRLFRIKVAYGTHTISITDKAFFHHMLFFTLYRPALGCISIIPLVPLRQRLLTLVGLTIEKGSLLSGTEFIDEPYGVEIGEHSLIGGYTSIYAHISHDRLYMKKVKIGNHCFIGNRSLIMPGVIIEDYVFLEPGSVVQEDRVLKKGKRYGGNPAKEIKSKKD